MIFIGKTDILFHTFMNQISPFIDKRISDYGSQFILGEPLPDASLLSWVKSFSHVRLVCRDWHAWFDKSREVWSRISPHFSVPLVAGPNRNYRADFLNICPKVSSVHGLLGEIVGPLPDLEPEEADALLQNTAENRMLLIDFPRIRRRVGKDAPFIVQNGILRVSPQEAKECTVEVDATLGNLLELAKFPIKGKELKVQCTDENILNLIHNECTTFPNSVELHFHRKYIPNETRNGDFIALCNKVKVFSPNEAAETVRRRFLFAAQQILAEGTYPDGQGQSIMGEETVTFKGKVCNLIITPYLKGGGLFITPNQPDDHQKWRAVVPGRLAQVRSYIKHPTEHAA